MSTLTVARDDFTNARRSYAVLGVVGVFSVLVALLFAANSSNHQFAFRTLFDVSFLVFLLLPIILAPLTYLAIAGDLDGGAIKYVMGLPNTRSQYVFGKLLSRLSVGLAAVVIGTVAGFAIALVTYSNAPEVVRFAEFAAVTLLFAFSWVGIYVGVSALTDSRSRAMLGAFVAYFVLVPFWFGFLPVVSLLDLLGSITDVLGVTLSQDTQSLIQALSPATAYLRSTEIIYTGVVSGHERIAQTFSGQSTKIYAKVWFNALVMLGWGVISMVVGYASFRRSELG
ncbi:ABC transporter permease subunit [Halobacterium jilantaiense]|uniref:ABC-2 type transport system permease protein n=1 Tax=Halobacterium jilantaiense TaxID=355548 RepID=A0A1I0PQ12_9EURY|nr:ABC transporter permease subunit [Halobacterium jilantaiense]SEW16355.1 ABC-2 type transport system permease protein [Halobacterium jilantaiense]